MSMVTANAAAREKADDQKDPADEFCKNRYVAEPGWNPHARHVAGKFMHVPAQLVISVGGHYHSQGQPHDQQPERLHSIQIMHSPPP